MADTIIRFISLAVGRFFGNPRKACIILAGFFVFVLILGNWLGRNGDDIQSTPAPVITRSANVFFDLPEIKDPTITPEPRSTDLVVPEKTILTTVTPTMNYCETQIAAGMNVSLNYVRGYVTVVSVRSGVGGAGNLIGELRSGDIAYVLDGPVCNNSSIWWKINSGEKKIIGWIPERIGDRILISPGK